MLWKLMQLSIVIAIIGSNIANHWAPTGLAAGVVAIFAAFVATGIISELLRFYRWLKRPKVGPAIGLTGALKRLDHE